MRSHLHRQLEYGYRPSPAALLYAAGQRTADAHEIEHLMTRRAREGLKPSRGIAKLHADLHNEARDFEEMAWHIVSIDRGEKACLLYTSPSPRD